MKRSGKPEAVVKVWSLARIVWVAGVAVFALLAGSEQRRAVKHSAGAGVSARPGRGARTARGATNFGGQRMTGPQWRPAKRFRS